MTKQEIREMHLEIDRLLIENEALKEENKRNKEVARDLSLELEKVRNQIDDLPTCKKCGNNYLHLCTDGTYYCEECGLGRKGG
ncbi:MAG: hypothetical protein Q8Q33_03360 [Chlamydiota bacterium]|nr:hypothetical protein [Chlamydiota bacterium]